MLRLLQILALAPGLAASQRRAGQELNPVEFTPEPGGTSGHARRETLHRHSLSRGG